MLTGIFPGAGIGPTSSEQSSPENIYAYTYILEQIERKSIIAYYKECILMQKKKNIEAYGPHSSHVLWVL